MKRLIAAALLLAPAAAGAKDAPSFDPAANPASLAAEFFKTSKPQALKGIKRVAIANFRVEFAVENSGKAQSSSSAGWTSSKSVIKLAGVDDATRQAIADSLYDKLVENLTAAGIEVIPYETLRENERYKSLGPVLKNTQEPFSTQAGRSVFLGAHGMPVYFTNDDKHLGLGTMLGGFSTTQPQNIEPRIAESLDAAVLRATLMVAFAELKKSGGMFRSGSSVKTSVGLAFVPDLTQYLFITPDDGKGRISLDHQVEMPDEVLTLRDTTTKGEKATQAVSNALTGLLAGGGRTERHYEANTTPEAYSAALIQYGSALDAAAMSVLR